MKNQPVTIAVAGGSGSGKTTVAEAILKRVGADQIAYLQHDSYYFDWEQLPLDLRPRSVPNFDHPNSLETDTCGAVLPSAGQAPEAAAGGPRGAGADL
jgi:uridine kinase